MPAPANAPQKDLHGVNGYCTIQTVSLSGALGVETLFNITMTDWSHDPGDEEVTNSGDGGWGRSINGVQRITGTLNFVYDVANRPFAAPYQLGPGNYINLKLVLNAIASPGLALADADLSQAWSGLAKIGAWGPKTGPQAGALICAIPFASQGKWTIPMS